MKFNPYIKLIIIALFFTIFSFIIEFFVPIKKLDLKKCNLLGSFFIRFSHYLCFLYFTIFLLIFNYNNIDGIIYLIIATIISSQWKILDCCLLSYYELKMYNIEHTNFLTTFHPCLFVYFREYQEFFLIIMGIIMAVVFYFILFKNKIIPIIYKLVLGIIFTYLFIDNAILPRFYKKTLEYPKSEKHIMNFFYKSMN
jgi:hypothetical protein